MTTVPVALALTQVVVDRRNFGFCVLATDLSIPLAHDLLVPAEQTGNTIDNGVTPTRITDQQITVVVDQHFAELILGTLIHILPIVRDDRSSNSSTNGVNL